MPDQETDAPPIEPEVLGHEAEKPGEQAMALERLAHVAQAEQIATRLVNLAQQTRLMSISKLTQPEDWVLSKDRAGNESAMIAASGVAKIRAPYGLYVSPLPGLTLEPERIASEDGMRKGYRLIFLAGCRLLGIHDQEMEAVRWDGEQFLGRDESPSDPRLATRTLAMTKVARELIGLKNVPAAELKAAGLDLSRCRKGTGYGTAKERAASGVAEPGVAELAKAFGEEILRLTGGDVDAASKVLYDITVQKSSGKYGRKSVAEFTKAEQIEWARKRLEQHEVFGRNREREPGE